MSDSHFRRLEKMYQDANCNAGLDIQLTISKGAAQIILPVKDTFFHAADAVHGAYYFKALDDATFFSANSLVEDVFVLTSSFNLYFTRPITKGQMRAEGKVVSNSKRVIVAEGILYDARDREIARGSGSFMRSRIPLDDKVGYDGRK